MALLRYYSEMQQQPEATFHAKFSAYSRTYTITSKEAISFKQGIKSHQLLDKSGLTPKAQHMHGWNEYSITEKAFKKLCGLNDVALEMLL